MQRHLPDWSKAIDYRDSVRKYATLEPDESKMEDLREVVQTYRPYPGARAIMVSEPLDVFTGAIGPIYKVTNPPYYVAFIADKQTPHHLEASGYMGEGVVLHATALGLNTCWVGGFFDAKKVRKQIEILDHEDIAAITPVGIAKNEDKQVGHVRETGVYHKRKVIDKIIREGSSKPKPWQLAGVEGARLAPSAVNRQPWRFEIDGDRVILHAEKSILSRGRYEPVDCGIAMLHFDLRASAAGANGKWAFLDDERVAEYSLR